MEVKNNCPFCILGCEYSCKKELKYKNCSDLNYHLDNFSRNSFPLIKGKKVSFDDAINKVIDLSSTCNGIHLDGLGCDYTGLKSIFNFAEEHRTSLDHMEGENISNLNIISQRIGGNFCSLGEVYKRSDLIFFSLKDMEISKIFVEFLNKSKKKRKLIIISDKKNTEISNVTYITKKEFLDLNKNLNSKNNFEGIKKEISHYISCSKFVTFICTFNSQQNFTRQIFRFVKSINDSNQRASILPINGKNNISGAIQYSLWKTGYPLRIQFTDVGVEYNPVELKSEFISKTKELQIYISCFDYKRNIGMFKKNIFIGNPFLKNKKFFDVFIPSKIPGIDQKGLVFRGDGITSIKLNKVLDSEYSSISEIFKRIT